MTYSTPELVIVGAAAIVVMGGERGYFDHDVSDFSQPMTGVVLGLDE